MKKFKTNKKMVLPSFYLFNIEIFSKKEKKREKKIKNEKNADY